MGNIRTFSNWVDYALSYVSILGYVIFVLAVVVFFWNLISYLKTSNADKRAQSLKYILNSLIAMVIMICVWGVVYFVASAIFPGFHPGIQEIII
jgi:hypothetical protein